MLASGGIGVVGLFEVDEERHRLAQAAQDDMAGAAKRRYRRVHDVGDAVDGDTAAATGDTGVGALGDQLRASGGGDAMGMFQGLGTGWPRLPSTDQSGNTPRHRISAALRIWAGSEASLGSTEEGVGDNAAIVPGRVGGRDWRGDLAGMGAGSLHRDGYISSAHGEASRCRVRTQSGRRRVPSPRCRRSAGRRSGDGRWPGRRRH